MTDRLTDTALINEVRAGNAQRFGELVERYERLVYAIAWSRLGDSASCEDATQETFLRVYQHVAVLRNASSFRPWLCALARSVAAQMARGRTREQKAHTGWKLSTCQATEPYIEPERNPAADILPAALERLRVADRECLTLFYIERRSVHDCAQALGISEGAVKVRLHRARKTLRTEVEGLLASSVSQVKAEPGLSQRVMAAIPMVAPVSGKWKTLSAFCMYLIPVLPPLLVVLLVRALRREEMSNFRDDEPYRRILQESNVRVGLACGGLCLLVFILLLASAEGTGNVDNRIAWFFSLVCGVTLLDTVFYLPARYNAYKMVDALGCAFMFVVAMHTILTGDPFRDNFQMVLLWIGVSATVTWKSRPMRMDHSLYLRAVRGKLSGRSSDNVEASGLGTKAIRQLIRMLGSRVLADRVSAPHGGGARVWLSPVRVSLLRLPLLFRPSYASYVDIHPDSSCEAHLSARDAESLRILEFPVDAEALNRQVAGAVTAALVHLQAGNMELAWRVLEPDTDAHVFRRLPYKLPLVRVFNWCVIATGVICAYLWVYEPAQIFAGRWGPEVDVTHELVCRAMDVFIASRGNKSSHMPRALAETFEQPALPCADFWSVRTRQKLNRILMTELLWRSRTPASDLVAQALERPATLYNALHSELVTPEELHRAGFTREAVLCAEARAAKSGESLLEPGLSLDMGEERLQAVARRAWCLNRLGMRDVMNVDALTSGLRSLQHRGDYAVVSSGCAYAMTGSDGLFPMRLDLPSTIANTWAALVLAEAIGRPDALDREACTRSLLSMDDDHPAAHSVFEGCLEQAGFEGQTLRYYYAESLRMLDALPRSTHLNLSQPLPRSGWLNDGAANYGRTVQPAAMAIWAYRLQSEESSCALVRTREP